MFNRIIKHLGDAGISAIRTDELVKADITIGDEESIDKYIDFCKKNGINTLFYFYLESRIERKPVNADKVKESMDF